MDATHHIWNDLPEDAPLELLTRRRVLGEKAMPSREALEDSVVLDVFSPPSEGTGIDQPQGG